MKSIVKVLTISLLLGCFSQEVFSQGPPPWAPAHGYRAKTRYVYFPEQNFYYDLNTRNYIYLNGPNWSVSVSLPKLFVGVNLGKVAQVELDFVGDRPYVYNGQHIVKYKVKKIKKSKRPVNVEINVFEDDDHGHHGRGHGNGHGRGHGRH